ncbi:MAG: cellulase family glycosylhydrolase [Bacteroidaceae bacterium]|nr:cellulase family glycosylhydrolase [Bacteroidaceae bacterium]
MKRHLALLILLAGLFFMACQSRSPFVTVRDGHFRIGESPYTYVGTNLWYGAILGSEGQGGNRERLKKELNRLCELGVKNVRILVGGEGMSALPDHIRPTLQPEPGLYNDTLLQGLDYLMAELGRRDMRAVLYLHNAWQWSGGYGTYLEWAGEGEAAPAAVWNEYTQYHSRFVRNEKARQMALRHTRFIVGRTNTVTGQAYRDDPALMAWEICNEPRPFARDSTTKAQFLSWIEEQAKAIKEIDPHHLVTTGSEGKFGCEVDIDLFERIHALPQIDYLCIHIWPFTWNWIGQFASPSTEAKKANDPAIVVENVDMACTATKAYIDEHATIARRLGKPLVLEEFGYPRDAFEIRASASTTGRDRYYEFVLSQVRNGNETDDRKLDGCNFWAWGGSAHVRQPHPDEPLAQQGFWLPWDDYTGDPALEEQGLYSVFSTDTITLHIIRHWAKEASQQHKKR